MKQTQCQLQENLYINFKGNKKKRQEALPEGYERLLS